MRINTPGTEEPSSTSRRSLPAAPDALLIPKVSGPEDVREVARLVSGRASARMASPTGRIAIAAVIERIRALSTVEEIAVADPRHDRDRARARRT